MSLEPEKISALMDNALDKDERRVDLEALLDDRAACGYWERYHLVGAVLRGQEADLQLTERIRMALAQLPDLPAQVTHPHQLLRSHQQSTPSRWYWAGAGGMALAASAMFAVVALMSFRTAQLPEAMPARASAAAVPHDKLEFQASYASTDPPHTEQINRYLVGHYAAASGNTGALPFVTLVGYEGRNGSR